MWRALGRSSQAEAMGPVEIVAEPVEPIEEPVEAPARPAPDDVLVHISALRRYALVLVGDTSDADDLVQECLLRVIAQARSWRPVRDLRAYMFTTLHNVFIDGHRRRKARASEVPIETVVADLVAPPSQNRWLEVRDLVTALGKLPSEQREVVLLVGLEGMSYLETAGVLGIPVGTVMSRLSRGREALRRLTSQGSSSKLRVVK
jgi:RNA polymerase sigma-70 factor (ECF subfamily)